MTNKVEGKIIIAFMHTPTPEQILTVERYLNGTIDKIVYANKGASIRVHLTDGKVK